MPFPGAAAPDEAFMDALERSTRFFSFPGDVYGQKRRRSIASSRLTKFLPELRVVSPGIVEINSIASKTEDDSHGPNC
jgi:hypothetical protein